MRNHGLDLLTESGFSLQAYKLIMFLERNLTCLLS